mmetsp:Transcript_35235/g.92755  ORF Transcript_35235/g.92755 Transcript_35235/m.92755 type:complete len:245 (-) Transcript_35235:20-754(-)
MTYFVSLLSQIPKGLGSATAGVNRAWISSSSTSYAKMPSIRTTVPKMKPQERTEPTSHPTKFPTCLILNITLEPLSIVPLKRGLVLVQKKRAEVLESSETVIRSERSEWVAPSVLVLRRFVNIPRFEKRTKNNNFSNISVLRRDEFTCGYCGGEGRTIDHIVPRSRGGSNAWDNLVACCHRCNSRKANRLLSELSGTMRLTPRALHSLRLPPARFTSRPVGSDLLDRIHVDPRWSKFAPARGAN